MNDGAFEVTGREPEKRYDPVGEDRRAMSMQPDRTSPAPRQGLFHAPKIGQIVAIMGMVIFVASFTAFTLTGSTGSSARASIDGLGPSSISADEQQLTASVTEYPVAFNGTAIPQTLIEQGQRAYLAENAARSKAYIINRIVLYYITDEYLTKYDSNYISSKDSITFEGIENELPAMLGKLRSEYPEYYQNIPNALGQFTFEGQ